MNPIDSQLLPNREIMIVEDNTSNLKFLAGILKKAGYRVRPAVDGEMALRSVQARLPDLILLDVKLPGMDGVEICRRLKSDPGTKEIPVIFISALQETELKVRALEVGGIDYITKPFSPSEVLTRINIHIKMHQLQQGLAAKSRELGAEIEVRKKAEEELEKHRKHLEELVAERTAELRDSKTRYEEVISMISDIVWRYEMDDQGKFVASYISPVADRLLGLPPKTIGDSFDRYFSYLHSEDLPGVLEIFFSGLATVAKKSFSEYRLHRPDGKICWVRSHGSAYLQPDGHIVAFGTTTDITEHKQTEEKLRQSYKMEAIGTLTGGIAHEFNNMLGIILGNSELALDDLPKWNPVTECLEEIKIASLRARDVVRKLLRVARKSSKSRQPILISDVVKEALSLLRRTIPSTIDLRPNILCKAEMILADSTEINQIMINLCTNSVHAMDEKTGVLEIGLEVVNLDHPASDRYEDLQPGDYVRLTVKDTGEGISPDIMNRIFDPYFTTKDVDKGLGMGLAVVHGIVKEHSGAIAIKSEVGKGTTVEVLFPLIDRQPEFIAPKTDASPTGTERILLIDDETSMIKIIKQMIERSGYEVVAITSSLEALALFKADPVRFDLVITDMAMPDMPGDWLTQEIFRIRPGTPIILCTGHSDRMDEKKANELGIKAFIMKPLTKKDLTKIIRQVLDETGDSNQKRIS